MYEILDDTVADVDIIVGSDSVKCVAQRVRVNFPQENQERATFCSNSWREPRPTFKGWRVRLEAFLSKGGPFSNPIFMLLNKTPKAFEFTADTGCTVNGDIIQADRGIGMAAGGDSEDVLDAIGVGAPSVSWVVA